jgi:hypothetical protein
VALPNPNLIPHLAAHTLQRRILPSGSRRRRTPLWCGHAARRRRLSASCPLDALTSPTSRPLDFFLPASRSWTPTRLPDSLSVDQPLSLAPYHTTAQGHRCVVSSPPIYLRPSVWMPTGAWGIEVMRSLESPRTRLSGRHILRFFCLVGCWAA